MNALFYKNHYNKILINYLGYLFITYILFLFQVSPSVFLLISGTIATCLFGWIMYTEFRNNDIRITPILATSIIPFFMLGISAIYKSYIYTFESYEALGPRLISKSSILPAYLMVNTGLFFQILGTQFFIRKNKLKNRPKLAKHHLKLILPFTFFLLLSQITGYFLTLGMIQNFLYQIPLAILIFLAISDKENLLTSYYYKRNFVLIGSVILFLFNIAELSKTLLVYSLFPVILFYIFHSANSKKIRITAIIIFTSISSLYFLFVQPLVSNARLYSKIYNVEITPSILLDFITSGDYKITLSNVDIDNNPVEIFLNRMFELNAPAFIYDLTKESGFLYGKSFESIGYGLVPRIIWSEKPSLPQGQKFSELISGMTTVYIGMLVAGELYWNFGFVGIILGSLIIGIQIGFLWYKLNKYVGVNFIYFTLFVYLLQSCLGGSEFTGFFIGMFQLIIIFYIVRIYEHIIQYNK